MLSEFAFQLCAFEKRKILKLMVNLNQPLKSKNLFSQFYESQKIEKFVQMNKQRIISFVSLLQFVGQKRRDKTGT